MGDLPTGLLSIPLGLIERRLAFYLANRLGQWVDTDTLVRAAYFDHPDGGPLSANDVVKVTISGLRKKVRPIGLRVEGIAKCGRRMVRA